MSCSRMSPGSQLQFAHWLLFLLPAKDKRPISCGPGSKRYGARGCSHTYLCSSSLRIAISADGCYDQVHLCRRQLERFLLAVGTQDCWRPQPAQTRAVNTKSSAAYLDAPAAVLLVSLTSQEAKCMLRASFFRAAKRHGDLTADTGPHWHSRAADRRSC